MRKFDELLIKPGHFFDDLLYLWRIFRTRAQQSNRSSEEPLFRGNRQRPSPLHTFHQNLDIAVGELDALHDVGERSDGVNLFRLGVIHGCIVLRGKKNLLVARQRFFQRADARLTADDKRCHLLREDDHVAHRHHRHALHFLFFASEHSVPWILLMRPGHGRTVSSKPERLIRPSRANSN